MGSVSIPKQMFNFSLCSNMYIQRVAWLVHFVSKSALGVGLWASGWEHEKKGKRNLTLTCSEGVCSRPTYDALLLSDRLELLQIPL